MRSVYRLLLIDAIVLSASLAAAVEITHRSDVVAAGARARAQDAGQIAELAVTPLQGPPGTSIAVTGRCIFEGQPGDGAAFSVISTQRTSSDPTPTTLVETVDSFDVLADAGGDLSGMHTLNEAPGVYLLVGTCHLEDFQFGSSFRADFVMSAPPGPAPTSLPTQNSVLDRTG